MKKVLALVFAIVLSIGSFVFPMKKPSRSVQESIDPMFLRIEDLKNKGDEQSKKTLKILASLCYYIECLCEVVNSEKIAAKVEQDASVFDEEMNDLVQTIDQLLNELDEEDRSLFYQFDRIIASSFNFSNLITFINARKAFAKGVTNFLTTYYDLICFVRNPREFQQKGCTNFCSKIIKVFNLSYEQALIRKKAILERAKELLFFDIDQFTEVHEKLNYKRMANIKEAHTILSEKESCAFCKRVQDNMKQCSRCKATHYCSIACQKKDWVNHRKICNSGLKTKYEMLKNIVNKALSASERFNQMYQLMKDKYDKISRQFVGWYKDANEFKLCFSNLYSKLQGALNEAKLTVYAGCRKGKPLPPSIFFINDCINKENVTFLRVIYQKVGIIRSYCDKLFGRNNIFHNQNLELKKFRDYRLKVLRDEKMDIILQSYLARLLSCELWNSSNTSLVISAAPSRYLASTFKYYETMLDKKIKEIKRELQNKKNKQNQKRKIRKKKARSLEKCKVVELTTGPERESSSQENYPKNDSDTQDECSSGQENGSNQEIDHLVVAHAIQELRNGLFGGRDISVEVDGDICIRQVWGSLDVDSMSCVLYKEYKNKHNKENLDFELARDSQYTRQDKFHGFSYLIDDLVNNGYGTIITQTADLPDCCKGYRQPKLESSGRSAIIIKGKLTTTKRYFYKVKKDGIAGKRDAGFIRERGGRCYEIFNGYFMYIWGEDGKLIHRCFHKEYRNK